MKANNIKCREYNSNGQNGMTFVLEGITPQNALETDWSIINITTDDDEFVEAFAGYKARSVTLEALTNYVYLDLVTGDDATSLTTMQKLAEENALLREEVDVHGNLLEVLLSIEEMELV